MARQRSFNPKYAIDILLHAEIALKSAREITELLNKEIQFYSQAPRYYFTQLADLKIELISKATEDAKLRAEMIAKNSGATLSNLISAKAKTASITMKLDYSIK